MNIGILTIGDELTSGRIQNTNAAWLAAQLHREGWHIATLLSVGDDEAAICRALDFLPDHCNAVIVTGGLGPTPDDITAEAVAKACGLLLVKNEQVLTALRNRFEACSFHWSASDARMALFPEGAEIIPNPVGSAAGFSLTHRGCLFIVLPGVPAEATRMFTDSVMPRLKSLDPAPPRTVVTRTLKFFGIGESDIEDRIRSLVPQDGMVQIGYYPQFPEVHLVLTARHAEAEKAQRNLQIAEGAITETLKAHLLGRDDETLAGVVGTLLTEKGLTLAVAESCTGGLIADLLTDVSGSSRYVERGVVTYSNTSKTALLGVPEFILVEFGAVSEPTAKYMAEGIRSSAGVDLGLSTTGIAGPTGAVPGKPVGTVFIAVAGPHGTICRHFSFHRERRKVKLATTYAALMLLREYLRPAP